MKWNESHSVVFDSLRPHGLYSPWNSPSHLSLPQRIFPTQGSNRGLPHYRRILYQLSHKGSHIYIYIYIWVYIITYINIWFKHFYWNIIVLCNKLHILKVYNLLKFWFMLSNISLYSFIIFSILSSCLICYYYWSTLFHLH